MEKIRVGMSSCLMGINVRYDGGHKLDSSLIDTLEHYFKLIPICPEVECGLGIPRKPMLLEDNQGSSRLIIIETEEDVTELVIDWALKRVVQLEKENIRGFIFKSDSPSCGVRNVKVYNKNGVSDTDGVGIFSGMLIKHFPSLLVEDELNLKNYFLREDFIKKIFASKKSPVR